MSEDVQPTEPGNTTTLLDTWRIVFCAVLLIIAVVDFLINIIRGRKSR